MSEALKLEPYDIYRLRDKAKQRKAEGYTQRDIIGLINSFIASGCDCCKVCSSDDEKKAFIECSILRRSIKSGDFMNVKAVLRGEEVFLVKKDRWEEITSKGADDRGEKRKTAGERSED